MEAPLRERLATDPMAGEMLQALLARCEVFLKAPPLERIQTGRRLLDVSRLCLERLTHLAMAFRLTDDPRFLRRAEAEMLAAAAFSDWNPSHFLDTAEMTMALALGLDWLHADLAPEVRRKIVEAIVEKGLRPSLPGPDGEVRWLLGNNNWNQVCNAGMAFGALAVLEDEPELAGQIIHRSIESVEHPMREYAPDGAYPEGPNYWDYGTTFNVLLIAALDSALGTDHGLRDAPGFAKTPFYFLQMHGPSGDWFNYSDGGSQTDTSVAMFWFARWLQDDSLLFYERALLAESLRKTLADPSEKLDRLFPLLLLWSPPLAKSPPPPEVLHWFGKGRTPVAIHRSSFTEAPRAYLAIKAGSPAAPHAHMDIGSFIYEADGVRWSIDPGSQSYHPLEARGLQIWERSQTSDRWRVFRHTNFAHSTLVVDGQLQNAASSSPITESNGDPAYTIVDLSPAYAGQLAAATRRFSMTGTGEVRIDDDITPLRPGQLIRWAMNTPSEVSASDGPRLTLRAGGKTLHLEILSPAGATWRTWPTDPPQEWDAENPGTRLVGFEITATSQDPLRLSIRLFPEKHPPDGEGAE